MTTPFCHVLLIRSRMSFKGLLCSEAGLSKGGSIMGVPYIAMDMSSELQVLIRKWGLLGSLEVGH